MDYKEFVEELVKEIGKETGFRVEFCAADEECRTWYGKTDDLHCKKY